MSSITPIKEELEVSPVSSISCSPETDSKAVAYIPNKSQNEEERPHWSSQWEFFCSCISISVGLGNIWRFPVAVYQNGGGAFLIPYFIILCFVGTPVYFLELCLGQFSSRNHVQTLKRAVPLFSGVGYGMMLGSLCVLTYYCSILALPVYYFSKCFENPLPWTLCDEKWAGDGNCQADGNLIPGINQSLAELFFKNEVLKERSSIADGIGSPDWKLCLCMLFTWIVIYFAVMKGVKSLGKVAYFTAIFPYIVLLVLFIRGITLPKAWSGIYFFIRPEWNRILEPSVWYEAAIQVFFSLTTGLGAIIVFASYNPINYNILRDSILLTLTDTLTSLLAGFTTFAILGNVSSELGVKIPDLVKNGDLSLAFVTYPIAITKIDWAPQFISAIFFLMVFFLGFGSSTTLAASISIVYYDRYPEFRKRVITLFICVIGFGLGIVYLTPGGQPLLHLVDYFSSAFLLFMMSTLEVVGIAWCYGLDNFLTDIEFMLGRRLSWFWKLCWGIVIPLFLSFIFVYSLIQESLDYNGVPYPASALICGMCLALASFTCLLWGAWEAVRELEGTWFERIKKAVKPKASWGPRRIKDRKKWREFVNLKKGKSVALKL